MAEAPAGRRRHPAAVARILTAGGSIALTSGIVALLGATAGATDDAPAPPAAPAPPPPPPAIQRIIIRVRPSATPAPATPVAVPRAAAVAAPRAATPRRAAPPVQARTRAS